MRPKTGKLHWLASCSIGCRNGVVLSPMRLAESRVQGATATACQFMQQSRVRLTPWPPMVESGYTHLHKIMAHHNLLCGRFAVGDAPIRATLPLSGHCRGAVPSTTARFPVAPPLYGGPI